jgi:hypothetical protein
MFKVKGTLGSPAGFQGFLIIGKNPEVFRHINVLE